jgi:hypothetical protein
MASGVSSPWGYSPLMVAGINNSLDKGNTHLTGQMSLTSTPVNGLVSPLTIKNESYYTAFGKKKSVKNVNADIKFLKKLKE